MAVVVVVSDLLCLSLNEAVPTKLPVVMATVDGLTTGRPKTHIIRQMLDDKTVQLSLVKPRTNRCKQSGFQVSIESNFAIALVLH